MVIDRTDEKTVRLTVDKTVYPINVLHKCFYWYAGLFEVEILNLNDGLRAEVVLAKKDGEISDEYLTVLQSRVKRDLIDFKTRDIVSNETANVRDLLIAKAFSNSDEIDEIPPGAVTDPVGFDHR